MMYVTDRRDLCSISCPRLDHHHHHQYHHHNHHYHHHHHPHHHLPNIVHILWQLHCTGSSWSIWIWIASKNLLHRTKLAGLLDPINWPPLSLHQFKILNTSKHWILQNSLVILKSVHAVLIRLSSGFNRPLYVIASKYSGSYSCGSILTVNLRSHRQKFWI